MRKLAIILTVASIILLANEITHAQQVINDPTDITKNGGTYIIGQSFTCPSNKSGVRVFGDSLVIKNPHGHEVVGSGEMVGFEVFGKAVIIEKCIARGFRTGIFMNADNGVINGKIVDCQVYNNFTGIMLSGSVNNEVSRNIGSGNEYGIHVSTTTSRYNWGRDNKVRSHKGDIGCMVNTNHVYNIVIPRRYTLEQNYPNPFNSRTVIEFGIPVNSYVKVTVFNTLGQEVATLVDHRYPVGWHSLTWDASRMPSGVYSYRIKAGEFIMTKRMMLVR